ncbi:MAG: hypothetical protein A2W97_14545 [Bacteroidetes bacterium GWE2_40_63]|nr:MAG: hypothetical protein A2W97_14545 [Bacteroidetes bacterium GWE2_40_63]OFY19808.1 MAG: hypothetical protein A2W88_03415 [Bacteroidetes bacterium GWF2_40_13]HBX84452.1 hypothetical protein [Marinilabiliales bacterium]HBY54442.1 hypothetical protein [Marinilabiliales bacterium]
MNYETNYYRTLFFLVGVTTLLFVSCKQDLKSISKVEMKMIAEKQNKLLEACFSDGDANKLANIYTDSAKLSPNGSHFVIGRDSIRAFWMEDFKTAKVLKMETNVLMVDGNEDVIYETGITVSEILYNDSVYRPRVKYINVWLKQPDGTYQLDVDFWNKDTQ